MEVEGWLPEYPGPGSYRLELDLVAEGLTWFAFGGSPTVWVEAEVREEAGS